MSQKWIEEISISISEARPLSISVALGLSIHFTGTSSTVKYNPCLKVILKSLILIFHCLEWYTVLYPPFPIPIPGLIGQCWKQGRVAQHQAVQDNTNVLRYITPYSLIQINFISTHRSKVCRLQVWILCSLATIWLGKRELPFFQLYKLNLYGHFPNFR